MLSVVGSVKDSRLRYDASLGAAAGQPGGTVPEFAWALLASRVNLPRSASVAPRRNNSLQQKLEHCCTMGGEYVQNYSDASFADFAASASASA
jgi:hypothetical protein